VRALAPTLQAFFTKRLIHQRHASGHTINAYRGMLRLLLGYASQRTSLAPSALDIADLDAKLIAGFLDHLETERGNSVRTRNARAGQDLLAVPLRSAGPSQTCPAHLAGLGDPIQTL
jgi:site-specific recombinase XerD